MWDLQRSLCQWTLRFSVMMWSIHSERWASPTLSCFLSIGNEKWCSLSYSIKVCLVWIWDMIPKTCVWRLVSSEVDAIGSWDQVGRSRSLKGMGCLCPLLPFSSTCLLLGDLLRSTRCSMPNVIYPALMTDWDHSQRKSSHWGSVSWELCHSYGKLT